MVKNNFQKEFDKLTDDFNASIKPLMKIINDLSDVDDELGKNSKNTIATMMKSIKESMDIYREETVKLINETFKDMGINTTLIQQPHYTIRGKIEE